MGNEIAKKYEMDDEPSASGGLACLWKIYKATDKASGEPVSVFVFTKEDLKEVDKALREQVLVILRRELKVLSGMSTRKHPSVVRHIESFEETKKLLAFVTERVSCSLADAIGESPSGGISPAAASSARRGFERYEIARGFFGLCEGLQFVHTIRRRLHLNLAPESIFLAPSGQFKLGGFGFSVDLPSNGSSTTPCPYFQTGARSGFEGKWRLHPVMAFSSPEATAPAGNSDVSCASDMFSLGCLMYQLCRDNPAAARLITADATPQAHQTFCATLDYPGRVNVSNLFPEVQNLVTSLVQAHPTARPLLGNVTINPMFHGTEVTVLKTIDGIPGRNPAEAATFLTSIRPAVSGFPLRVQRDCIMHPLMDACAAEQSGRLWAFALPIVVDVCEQLSRKDIIGSVQAKFRPALLADSLEALGSLVAAMPLFLKKMDVTFFRSDVVPMVCRALQAQGNPQVPETARKALGVQEAALKGVSDEAFHGAIDGKTRELSILPRVCWLVVKGAAVRVKVNALLCLSKTFHLFQVRAVVDKILPTLKFCAERDETVAIQLCVLGCYDAVAKRLEKLAPVATHILPACTPMLACKGLNSNQFEMAVGIVQGMLESIIAYRRREIANPSATAINYGKPTLPGGEVDETEVTRVRALVLGGWKPSPASSSSPKPASKVLQNSASGFPGASSPSASSPRPTASSSATGFDMADMFSGPPLSTSSAGGQSASFSGNLAPTRAAAAPPVAAASTGIGKYTESRPPGPTSAADMFQGMSISSQQQPQQPVSNGYPNAAALPSPPSDPFTAPGMGDPFGGITAAPSAGPTAGGEMSWMGGGSAGGGLGGGVMGTATSGRSSATAAGGLSGLGGGAPIQASSPLSGARPPPAPLPPAVGGSGGDPFAVFFDAAMTGGSGAANSPQFNPVASPGVPVASTGMGGFMGGFGTAPVGSGSGGDGGGGGGGGGSGMGLGGATLEDQLAKTQREIAQLTRELGAGAMASAAGGMVGGGSSGWGMPGGLAGGGGGGGGTGAQGWPNGGGSRDPPGQQGQGAGGGGGAQDPFAFLGSNNSRDGQQGKNGQGGAGNGFDFFG